jgi:hypothetical protein
MKKSILLFFALTIFAGVGFSQSKKITIDSAAAKESYGNKISISPMDKSVSIKNNVITISPKHEEVVYTISGYFNGQIIIKTKNTELKLKNVYIENTKGLPAIYSEVKFELSAVQGTSNYILSSGKNDSKIGAIYCKKDLNIGGSGNLSLTGNIYHAVKADDIKMKGSGNYYFKGTSKGSSINSRSFIVESEKSFNCYLLDSKNGIKADNSIEISSGSFYFYNNKVALKTDTSQDDSSSPHFIKLNGGTIYLSSIEKVYSTEEKGYKSAGAKIIQE